MFGFILACVVIYAVGGLFSLIFKSAREDKEHVAKVTEGTIGCLGYFFLAALAVVGVVVFALMTGMH